MPVTATCAAAGEAGLFDDPGDVTFTGEIHFVHKPSYCMFSNPTPS
jgi:hypothetical protein